MEETGKFNSWTKINRIWIEMSENVRQLLILAGQGGLPDWNLDRLEGWTSHIARNESEARRLFALHPAIEVVITPADHPGEQFRAYCARHHPHPARVVYTDREHPPRAPNPGEKGPIPEGKEQGLFRIADHATLDDLRSTLDLAIRQDEKSGGSRRAASPGGEASLSEPGRVLPDEIQFRDDWVKIVTHDVRSPLSIIISYASMLLKHGYEMGDEARMIVERIHSTGYWAIELIDNVLDLALLDGGMMALNPESTTISAILSNICRTMQGLGDESGIALVWEAPRDEQSYGLDRVKIEQVLQNLVSNGIKFSSKGSQVRLFAEPQGEKILFKVQDTGCGMTSDEAARVFRKFSSTDSGNRFGRGLGLAIAKSIVELHGGELFVDSESGKGSVFYFTVTPQVIPHRPSTNDPLSSGKD